MSLMMQEIYRICPPELKIDYDMNQQRRNINFFKIISTFHRDFARLSTLLINILQNEWQNQQLITIRKNTLQLVKFMVVMERISTRTIEDLQFTDKLFNILVAKSTIDISGEQFQIASLMLLMKNIQQNYLDLLLSNINTSSIQYHNLSLCFLERLLFNMMQILQGKKKGPQIPSQFIQLICQKSFQSSQIQNLCFNNQIDYVNFLRVSQHSLYILRKFTSINNNKIQKYNTIWINQLNRLDQQENVSIKAIGALFGMMTELCLTKQTIFMDKFEEQKIFNIFLTYSQRFALISSQVNKFWKTYIMKRKNLLNRSLQSFYSVKIVKFFSQCLYTSSSILNQMQRKLQIVDNFLMINEFISSQLEIKSLTKLKANYAYNPQTEKAKQIMFCSFQALYSPLYKVKEDNIFYSIVQDMRRICDCLSRIPNYNIANVNNLVQYLDMLPFIKILISKCKSILLRNKSMPILIEFLFLYLGQDNKCIQNFIENICDETNSAMKLIPPNQKQIILQLNIDINQLIHKCFKKLQSECFKYNKIGGYVRSISNLIKITLYSSEYMHQYIMQLLIVVQIRNSYYDEQLHIILSRLIKNFNGSQNCTLEQFRRLKNIITESQRVKYLQLIFQIAENNCSNWYLKQQMQNSSSVIKRMCEISPVAEDLLRKVSYDIMIQSIQRDLKNIDQVIKYIGEIIDKSKFRSKLYRKIIQIVKKQRLSIQKFSCNIKNLASSIEQIIHIMLAMLRNINDTLQQNNQTNNEQKSQICCLVSIQITFYINKFGQKICSQLKDEAIQLLIKTIKQIIEFTKLGNFPKMIKAMKLLMNCYTWLQNKKKVESSQLNIIQFQNYLSLMIAEGFHKQGYEYGPEDLLLLISVSEKLVQSKMSEQVTHNAFII